MNRAGAFGRAEWVRTQLFYTDYSLDVHDRSTPGTIDLDALLRADYTASCPISGWMATACMRASRISRLLVELLHLSLRQGDCDRFLSPIRQGESGGWAGGDAYRKKCWSRAARNREKRWFRIFCIARKACGDLKPG